MNNFLNIIIGLVLLTLCQAQKEKLELNLTIGEIYNQIKRCYSFLLSDYWQREN